MTKLNLHWLISAEICLFILALILDLGGVSYVGLDRTLIDWINTNNESDLSSAELAAAAFILGSLFFSIFSWIWLWGLRAYSRGIYVAALLVSFIASSLSGTIVTNGWVEGIYALSSVVAGILIGGLYFTDIYKKEGEQAGAGQPATRSESDSESDDKSQPEAEGRSR